MSNDEKQKNLFRDYEKVKNKKICLETMRKCPLSHHQGHCILLQALWRPILESPKVLKTSIFLNQAALFLGIQAKEIHKWKDE